MKRTDYLSEEEYKSMDDDLSELIAMLTSTIIKKKNNSQYKEE